MRRTGFCVSFVVFIMTVFISLSSCHDPSRPDPDHPVTLRMWHTFGGEMRPIVTDLVDRFNETVGRENGVTVVIEAVAMTDVIDNMLLAEADGEPGIPNLPDISFIHSFLLPSLTASDLLVPLKGLFSDEELAGYVPKYIAEGVWRNELYLLPIVKACDVLYINETFFNRFRRGWFAEHGEEIDPNDMLVCETMLEIASKYYQYTDSLTPDIPDDGKSLFVADTNFNFMATGTEQLGGTVFDTKNGCIDFTSPALEYVFSTAYKALVRRQVSLIYDQGNFLMLTGDVIANTASSGEGSYFSDFVVNPDSSEEDVQYEVMPYPVFRGGKKISLRRGVEMGIFRSTPPREYGAALFLKWFTDTEANLALSEATGFLPVKTAAYETNAFENMKFRRPILEKAFHVALQMEKDYAFYMPGGFDGYMEERARYSRLAVALQAGIRDGVFKVSDTEMLCEKLRNDFPGAGNN